MNWCPAMLAFGLFAVGLTAPAAAAGDWHGLLGGKTCWPDCVGRYCCDDYRPKCPPCPQPVMYFTRDNYCGKCPPMAKPASCFTRDDYCRKPFSFNCLPSHYLKCWPKRRAAGP